MDAQWLTTVLNLVIHGDKFWERLQQVRNFFFRDPDPPVTGPRKVLVVGAGGVGKSTLANFLVPAAFVHDREAGEYQESIGVEEVTTDDGMELIILPGQGHRRSASWRRTLDEISQGNIRGVLIVGAFGFHSLGAISFKEHRLYEHAGKRKAAFLRAFFHECREDELRVLREVVAAVSKTDHRIWLLSLVTKQDLWWNREDQVRQFYESGEYAQIVQRLGDKPIVRHELSLASLVIRNLRTGRKELLGKTIGGYDQDQQAKSLARTIDVMDALSKWEQNQ